MSPRYVFYVLAAAATAAAPLPGQDSEFGLHGLGTVARQESARARGAAGAFALFDPLSPLAEAALADLERGLFAAQTQATRRTVEFADGGTYQLRDSRFPALAAAGRTPWRIRVAAGFATYLERSYLITRRDSLTLRGVTERFTDEYQSDGNVADIRVAAAQRFGRALALGGAFHVLVGSTQETVQRHWDDSVTYRNAGEVADVEYSGIGGSASAMVTFSRRLRAAAWVRADTRLTTQVRGVDVTSADLPLQAAGGVEWRPRGSLRLAGAVRWGEWGLVPNGHDTFGWSLGAEAGSPAFPVRLGVRRDRLAFGPGPDAPTELGITTGVGRVLSQGRARFELAVERVLRSGRGLDERLWTLHVGLVVQP